MVAKTGYFSRELLKKGYQFVKSTGCAADELPHYVKHLASGATKKIYSNDVVLLTKPDGQEIMKTGNSILTYLKGKVCKWTKMGDHYGWKPVR